MGSAIRRLRSTASLLLRLRHYRSRCLTGCRCQGSCCTTICMVAKLLLIAVIGVAGICLCYDLVLLNYLSLSLNLVLSDDSSGHLRLRSLLEILLLSLSLSIDLRRLLDNLLKLMKLLLLSEKVVRLWQRWLFLEDGHCASVLGGRLSWYLASCCCSICGTWWLGSAVLRRSYTPLPCYRCRSRSSCSSQSRFLLCFSRGRRCTTGLSCGTRSHCSRLRRWLLASRPCRRGTRVAGASACR